MNRFLLLVSLALALVGNSLAQLSVSPSATTYSADGGQIALNMTVTFPAGSGAVGVLVKPPGPDWLYAGIAGSNLPNTDSSPGDPTVPSDPNSGFAFFYISPPDSGTAAFTLVIRYPQNLAGTPKISVVGHYRKDNLLTTFPAQEVALSLQSSPPTSSIVGQPKDTAVTEGQTAELSVLVSGVAPLSYQWKKGSQDIAGATKSVLGFAPAMMSDGASYSVSIVTGNGSLTSASAVLTVTPAAPAAVDLSASPQVQSVKLAAQPPAANSVPAGTVAGPRIRVMSVPLTLGASSFQLEFALSNQVGSSGAGEKFAQIIANSAVQPLIESATGRVAALGAPTSIGAAAPTGLSWQAAPAADSPVALTLAKYALVSGSSGASSGAWADATAKSFGFRVNLGASVYYGYATVAVADISGQPAITLLGFAVYPVPGVGLTIPSTSFGAPGSGAVTLNVNSVPAASAVWAGTTANFSASASASTGSAVGYKWAFNGNPVSGVTTSTLSRSPSSVGDAGMVAALVDVGGAGLSAILPAKLDVHAISTQPQAATVPSNSTATFSVGVTTSRGDAAFGYQWYKAGSLVEGATNVSYGFTAATSDDQAPIYVRVTDIGVPKAPDYRDSNSVKVTVSSSGLTPAITTISPNPAVAGSPIAIGLINSPTSGTVTASIGGVALTSLSLSSGLVNATLPSNVPTGSQTLTVVLPGSITVTAPVSVAAGSTGPSISAQPVAQATSTGGSATFSVAATGSGTLAYKWYFTPTGSSTPQALSDLSGRFAGTQTATLIISGAQAGDGGDYVCVVSNGAGGQVTSNAAKLTVLERSVKLLSQSGGPGGSVTIPVQLVASGTENTVSFSVGFDASRLTYTSAVLGADSVGALINRNVDQASSGVISFMVGLEPGGTYSAGLRTVLNITFAIGGGVADGSSVPLFFGDVPTMRRIVAASGDPLSSSFVDGAVSVVAGLEGDVNGDGVVDAVDWVLLGRIVVGLDATPTAGAKFQRCDCGPRTSKGEGAIDASDWVQLGRYVVGFDAVQTAGGPTGQ